MADMETDTRDRVIRLEAQVEHMAATIDKMSLQVTALHDMLQQARGAKWIMIVVWLGLGGAITYAFNFLKLISLQVK